MLGDELRKRVNREEIDYLVLKDLLRDYVAPREKLRQLLRKEVLIRVKKGLYVFGSTCAREPYSKEVLANLIYGPSAISLAYALSFYGMIPERVEMLTSITNKRNKVFHTPVGAFNYRYLQSAKYAVGITQVMLDPLHAILIATPEKALVDQLTLGPVGNLSDKKELKAYLFENLRLEESALKEFKLPLLSKIAEIYQHPHTDLLFDYAQTIRRR